MIDAVVAAQQAAQHGSEVSDTVKFVVTVASVLLAALAIWVNGYRADRARRRELYAEAWEVVVEYKEFAFAVRRRDADHPAAERVRITTAMGAVQARLAKSEALVSNERSKDLASKYSELVAQTRRVAGGIVRDSWNSPPIRSDSEIHAPEIQNQLFELSAPEKAFHGAVRDDLAWWRVVRANRS